MTRRRPGPAEREIVAGPRQLAERAAAEVLRILGAALQSRGGASWVLAGGSTPRRLYETLADRPEAIDWRCVELFFGDERCVEPGSAKSNYRLAHDTLLAGLPLAPRRVHRVRAELPPAQAARDYGGKIEAALARAPFDLVLLGLGADGHVASLFPGAPPQAGLLVAPTVAPVEPRQRVTLTPAALRRCRHLLFLVSGDDKAPAVARALAPGSGDVELSGLVRPPGGRTLWLLDRAAASALPGRALGAA